MVAFECRFDGLLFGNAPACRPTMHRRPSTASPHTLRPNLSCRWGTCQAHTGRTNCTDSERASRRTASSIACPLSAPPRTSSRLARTAAAPHHRKRTENASTAQHIRRCRRSRSTRRSARCQPAKPRSRGASRRQGDSGAGRATSCAARPCRPACPQRYPSRRRPPPPSRARRKDRGNDCDARIDATRTAVRC
eukprot:1149550-Prymnesium_polylepis.2